MTLKNWPAAVGGAMVLIGCLSVPIWAVPPQAPPCPCPYPCPNVCVPNARHWGYFETRWRRWPGERRPEQVNPRSVGAERIPAPPGKEIIPPPRVVVPRPSQDGMYLPEGELVAPEGLLIPEEIPSEPAPGEESKPLFEDGLPGLPGLDIDPGIDPNAPPSVMPLPDTSPLDMPSTDVPQPEDIPLPDTSASLRDKTAPSQQRSRATTAVPQKPSAGVVPLDAGLTPERNTKFDVPRGNGGVAAMSGAIEPERNVRYDMPAYDSAARATTPPAQVHRDAKLKPVSGVMTPERSDLLPGVHRADSIQSSAPGNVASGVEPAAYAATESPGTATVGDQLAVPPVALGGYCPVELGTNGRWAHGDLRWTVVYKGLIYRLSGDRQRREFLADPERFAPVASGADRVLLVDEQRRVTGRPEFCAIYKGRLYMFSSATCQSRFNDAPNRYAVPE